MVKVPYLSSYLPCGHSLITHGKKDSINLNLSQGRAPDSTLQGFDSVALRAARGLASLDKKDTGPLIRLQTTPSNGGVGESVSRTCDKVTQLGGTCPHFRINVSSRTHPSQMLPTNLLRHTALSVPITRTSRLTPSREPTVGLVPSYNKPPLALFHPPQ